MEKAKAKCLDKPQHAEEEEALEKAGKAHKKAMKNTKKPWERKRLPWKRKMWRWKRSRSRKSPWKRANLGSMSADTLEKERQLKAKLQEPLEKARAHDAADRQQQQHHQASWSHAEHASDSPAEPNLGKGTESLGKGKDKGGHPHLCGLAQHLRKG